MQARKLRQPAFQLVKDLPGSGADQSVQQLNSAATSVIRHSVSLVSYVIAMEVMQKGNGKPKHRCGTPIHLSLKTSRYNSCKDKRSRERY
jgi:hypothetical protein